MIPALSIIGGVVLAAFLVLVLPWVIHLFDGAFELYERYLVWVERRRV
jgi:hypothetical protein